MKTVKQVITDVVSQLQYLWKILFFVYLPIALLFLLVGVLSRVTTNVSLAFLLRDITATAKLPFFTGLVSQFGLMLWSASLTICLFALVILNRQQGDFSASIRFLVYGTVLTAILALDDIFLLHEEVFPNYLHLDELLIYAAYMIAGVAFLLLNWREILSSEYALLLLALGLFATSIALDAIPKEVLPARYFWEQLELFLEDASKFAGIATWLLYFSRYAIQRIGGTRRNGDAGSLQRNQTADTFTSGA
jgi:hypothetical protein